MLCSVSRLKLEVWSQKFGLAHFILKLYYRITVPVLFEVLVLHAFFQFLIPAQFPYSQKWYFFLLLVWSSCGRISDLFFKMVCYSGYKHDIWLLGEMLQDISYPLYPIKIWVVSSCCELKLTYPVHFILFLVPTSTNSTDTQNSRIHLYVTKIRISKQFL